jgi:hypothetical protein
MAEVQKGHRMNLGRRLEDHLKLSKLAGLVEDCWEANAAARPTFKQLAQKCKGLVEDLKEDPDSSSEDDSDADADDVLKELQKGGAMIYTDAHHDDSVAIYSAREGGDIVDTSRAHLYEHQIDVNHVAESEGPVSKTSSSRSSGSSSESSSVSGDKYEHERGV